MHLTQTVSVHPAPIFFTPLINNPLTDILDPMYSELQPDALITQLLIEHVVYEDVHPEDKLTKTPDDGKELYVRVLIVGKGLASL